MTPKSMTLAEIKEASLNDKELVAIHNALLSGKWYDNPLLTPYKKFEKELAEVDGIILKLHLLYITQI